MKKRIGDIVKYETGTSLYLITGDAGNDKYECVWLGADGSEVPQSMNLDGRYTVVVGHRAPTPPSSKYMELFI